jgi:hypothetical protein
MRVDDAIAHYKTATQLAKELGLKSPGAITNWRARYSGKIPELYARRLHEMTRGKLKFDKSVYLESCSSPRPT